MERLPWDERQEAQTFEKDLMAVSGIQDGEDDGEPFEKKMIRLTVDLAEIFIKSHKFEDEIRERLEGNRL